MTSLRLLRWSAFPALCLLALSPLFAQTLSTQQFVVPTNLKISSGRGYTASEFSGILGVADFNRDGRNDILSSYNLPNGSSGLAILFRNSDGSYTPELAVNITAGTIADVNGDGIPDIVSVISAPEGTGDDGCDQGYPCGDSYLYVYLGNGNGTFRTSMSTDLGNMFADLDLVADLNKDGKPDLLIDETPQAAPLTYTVWTNQGAGNFKSSPVSFSGNYGGIVSGDFNGDGYADLALSTGQAIQIFLNNKGTGFTPGVTYPIATIGVSALTVGDLNKDGKLDLVAADFAGGGHILLGKGNGTFVQSAFNTQPTQGPVSLPQVSSMQLADVNGDGHPDISFIAGDNLSAGSILNSYLEVFAGTGKGTVGWPTVYNVGDTSHVVGGAQLVNLNGTGRLDLLVSSAGGFQVASNDGRGNFYVPRQNNTTYGPGSIVTADFNGDSIADVALVRGVPPAYIPYNPSFPASVVVYPGSGKGYFEPQHVYPIGVPPGVIASGDVNGDGIPDLVVARSAQFFHTCGCQFKPGSTDLSVLLGNGNGTFQAAKNFSVLGAPAVGDSDSFIQLADVNHDGKLDLIGDWGVALGKGDGSFDPPTALPLASGYINHMAAGDFNKDGTLDLAVGRSLLYPQSGTLYVLLGNGKGSFTVKSQEQLPNTAEIGSLAVADMNGDGDSDLVFYSDQLASGNSQPANLTVRLGDGNGSFGTPINYAFAAGSPYSFYYDGQMLIGDFNRDGIQDVLYLGSAALPGKTAPGPLMLLTGTGSGHLNMTPQYYITGLLSGVVLDMNGDGAPDVVGTTYTGTTRLLNTGSRK